MVSLGNELSVHRLGFVAMPLQAKQVNDIVPIADGTFLYSMKNSLNVLQFGFGVLKEQITIVGALHGPANIVNYDDYVWNRYRIGE